MGPRLAIVSAILLVAVVALTSMAALGSIRGARRRDRRENCSDDDEETEKTNGHSDPSYLLRYRFTNLGFVVSTSVLTQAPLVIVNSSLPLVLDTP